MQSLQQITAGKKFGEWFTENQEQYQQLVHMDDGGIMVMLEQINGRVRQYCPELEVHISLGDLPVYTLIISANGKADFFGQVDDLMWMAPQLQQWKFIALRPPADEWPIKFIHEDLKVSVEQLWFAPKVFADEPHKLCIMVYFKDYNPQKEDTYFGAATEILDRLLGERASAIDVPYMHVTRYPEKETDDPIFEMTELEEYIKSWKKAVEMN